MKITPNPNLGRELVASGQLKPALHAAGKAVAADAEDLAARWRYQTAVVVEGDHVEVRGTAPAQGVGNMAGWLEFGAGGTPGIPAIAPLRKAADRNGLRLRQ